MKLSTRVLLVWALFLLSLGSTDSFCQTVRLKADQLNNGQLQRIIDSADGSVVIQLEAEDYCLSAPLVFTGSAKGSIVIQGDAKHKTHLIGGVPLAGWEEIDGGLWRCRIPSALPAFDQLYVNGHAAIMARTPNSGVFHIKGVNPLSGGSDNQYSLVFPEEGFQTIDAIRESERPVITVFRKWTHSRQKVLSVDKKEHSLSFQGIKYPTYNSLSVQNTVILSRFRFALDEPGEWLPDVDGYVYYYPLAGEKIESSRFYVPLLERLVQIKGSKQKRISSIVFKNVVFEVTGRVMPDSGYEPGQASSSLSAAIEVDFADQISFIDCEVRNTANYGIWFRERCHDGLVSRCFFHDLGGGAMKIGKTQKDAGSVSVTSRIVIDNNIIRKYGMEMPNSVGILLLNASDNKLTHNDISGGSYTGISIGWTWGYGASPSVRNELAYNHVWNIGTGLLSDLGGIYTLGDATGTTIHHNRIHNIISYDFRGWGIYADEGTKNIRIENNLVFDCTSGGFHQNYGSGNSVRNNIFANGIRSQVTMSTEKGEEPLLFSNNIVLMKGGRLFSGKGFGKKNILLSHNCYWSTSGEILAVEGMNIQLWINTRESGSVYMNPLLQVSNDGYFRFLNRHVYQAIGFIPFDSRSAGVYGSRSWKALAAEY